MSEERLPLALDELEYLAEGAPAPVGISRGALLALIRELRAARKVVEAARHVDLAGGNVRKLQNVVAAYDAAVQQNSAPSPE